MTRTLSEKQQVQEDAYSLPAHWMILDRLDQKGRLYFGYLRRCISFLKGVPTTARILDAGCGDGRFLKELLSAGYANLYGTDYSARALTFAKLFVPEATFAEATLQKLPYEDGFFDKVFLIETLEHIPPTEIPDVLRELTRILAPRGELIITVPSLKLGPPTLKHYQHFTPESLTQTLTPVFSVTSMTGQDRAGVHPLKILYRLIDNKLWDITIVRKWYNKHVWPHLFNTCSAEQGRRLIARCSVT